MQKEILYYLLFSLNTYAICFEIPLCISLGEGCGPALTLRDLNLRTEAYPFDWIVSSFDALYNALIDDFKFFLSNLNLRSDKTGVIDYYGFHFTHDWPTIHNYEFDFLNTDFIGNCTLYPEWEKALPSVLEKYQRRIERFKNRCLEQKKIFFIRYQEDQMEPGQAIHLRDFFKSKYPQLNFVLLIFSNDPNCIQPWNMPSIINFYTPSWHDPINWATTLKQVVPEFKNLTIPKNVTTRSERLLICCNHLLDN